MASAFQDPLEPSLCDQCGHAAEGTIKCSVRDSKNLCHDCFQGLPQARGEDIGDPEWVCNIHLNRKVDDFCKTCQLGCCKECTVDVHQGHKVVDVLKLLEEIRCDLTDQLQEVDVRAERLSELKRKIDSSKGKIEEAPKLVDDLKEEVAQDLEKEVHRINWETEISIIREKRRRDNMLKLVKEKADLEIQRIQESHHGLLKDAERRRCKIRKTESKLQVGQQALESANLEIKSLLDSTPEKLVCKGRRLSSLVKASSSFQCQNDVLDCCREVEADLPELKGDVDFFVNCSRPLSRSDKLWLCIFLFYCVVNEARCDYRDDYNRVVSSVSIASLVMLCSYFPQYYAIKCLNLMSISSQAFMSDYQYQLTWKEKIMETLKYLKKLFKSASEFWQLSIFFFILVSSPWSIFKLTSMSAHIVFILSTLLSSSFIYQALPYFCE